MAKYLAISLAILKVVNEPRVINICLPICTTSINLVGLESKSTMLPASLPLGCQSSLPLRHPLAPVLAHRWCCHLSWQLSGLQIDIGSTPVWLPVWLGKEIIPSLCRNSERLSPRDHHGLYTHTAHLSKTLFIPPLTILSATTLIQFSYLTITEWGSSQMSNFSTS